MGKPFTEFRRARKRHDACALCGMEISRGEQYERTAWSFGPRRMGLRVRKEHAWAACLMDMEDEWLRERSEVPVEERVAVVTVFTNQVVAMVALDGSTIYETRSVPSVVMMTESELEGMNDHSGNDDGDDIPF